MRESILLAFFSAVLFAGWWFGMPPGVGEPENQRWEIVVRCPGPWATETWHAVGPVYRDEDGFVFVSQEHGRIRIEREYVIAIRRE